MKRSLVWLTSVTILGICLAISGCTGSGTDLPTAVEKLNTSMERFNEAILKASGNEAAIEKALEIHTNDLDNISDSLEYSANLEVKNKQRTAEQLVPLLKRWKDEKLNNVYRLAQTNAAKLSLTNKNIEKRLQEITGLNNRIKTQLIKILPELAKQITDNSLKETLEAFGGKYYDVRSSIEHFIKITNQYAGELENAKSAAEVIKSMNRFSNQMELLAPRMNSLNKKYPELQDLRTDPPPELKDLQGKGKKALNRLNKALLFIVPFIEDPDVQESMKRVDAALKTYNRGQ